MNITGKLIEIFKTVQITEKFQKREFVLEYAPNPKYPELVKFEIVQDKCALLDDFQVGDIVEVDFDLRGRKWTDKQGEVRYFTTVQAWRLSLAEGAKDQPSAKSSPSRPAAPVTPVAAAGQPAKTPEPWDADSDEEQVDLGDGKGVPPF